MDHKMTDFHLPSLRSQLQEYSTCEGFVMRNALPFHVSEYSRNVVKWVRKGHVQTDKHWMYAAPKRNHLAEIGGDRCKPLSADDWLRMLSHIEQKPLFGGVSVLSVRHQ